MNYPLFPPANQHQKPVCQRRGLMWTCSKYTKTKQKRQQIPNLHFIVPVWKPLINNRNIKTGLTMSL